MSAQQCNIQNIPENCPMKKSLRFTAIASAITMMPAIFICSKPASAQALPKQYQAAKSSLSTDYYTLYRVVEKLSRANNLVGNAWNVRLTENYAINSFADSANLIAVPKPDLQRLSSDVDAMACMVAREMSHHIRRHKAIGPQEHQALKQAITQEALQQAQANQNSKRNWGLGLGLVGGIIGINTGGVQNVINNNTDRATIKMIQEKEAELVRRMAETSARIDKQADEDAFLYLTRAGRDPKGCIRYLDMVARIPGAEPDPSNPQIPGRIQAYRDFIDKESPAKFRLEGNSNLSRNPTPLTFQLSSDKSYLIIHSNRGAASRQIDAF